MPRTCCSLRGGNHHAVARSPGRHSRGVARRRHGQRRGNGGRWTRLPHDRSCTPCTGYRLIWPSIKLVLPFEFYKQ